MLFQRDFAKHLLDPDHPVACSDGGAGLHFVRRIAFAEAAVLPEIALAEVDPEAPLEGCAPFACGLSTGIGAALNTAQVEAGSTVVVFGAGLVGLGAVIGAQLQCTGGSSRSTSPRSASRRRATTEPPTRAPPARTRSSGSAPRPAASARITRWRRRATSQ